MPIADNLRDQEVRVKIVLEGETGITLLPEPGMLNIEASSADEDFSPFHMLGSSLATCTFAVLYSWAEHTGLHIDDLSIKVEWEFGGEPERVTRMQTRIHWPSLPENRKAAAERASTLCTVHRTLTQAPQLETVVTA